MLFLLTKETIFGHQLEGQQSARARQETAFMSKPVAIQFVDQRSSKLGAGFVFERQPM